MTKIGVELYTFNQSNEPLNEILHLISETQFDCIELVDWLHSLGERPESELSTLRRDLIRTGFDNPTVMTNIDMLEDSFEQVASTYSDLGCRTFATGPLDPSYFENKDSILSGVNRLEALSDRLAKYDCDLLYHNHEHEFDPAGGRSGFEILMEELDSSVGLALDTAWVALGGRNPGDVIEAYAPRIPIVHIKDIDLDSGSDTQLGDGDIDVTGCLEASSDAGVDRILYEYDTPEPTADLSQGEQILLDRVDAEL